MAQLTESSTVARPPVSAAGNTRNPGTEQAPPSRPRSSSGPAWRGHSRARVVLGSIGGVMSGVAYYLLRAEKEGTSAAELAKIFD